VILPFQGSAVAASIPIAVAHLKRGGLLAYPTETVYGLGGNVSEASVRGVAALKGREPGKPFLLIISDPKMAEDLGLLFNASARALSREFWPGPLTLALPGGPRLPEMLRGPEGGVAVRHTGHADLARLVAAFGAPITSTSANRPGRAPAPGAETLLEEFTPEIDAGALLVLDGGVLGRVPPSTLIDCTQNEPRLVREGAIPREELRRLVGRFAP
jgi:L-threonylcarbamoyladenylate synthase